MSDEGGMVTIRSAHPVPETIERLVAAVTSRGLSVFARIDHAAGAARVGLELRPTMLVIFGNSLRDSAPPPAQGSGAGVPAS